MNAALAVLLAATLASSAVPLRPGQVRTSPLRGFDGRWVLDAGRSEFGGAQSVLRSREDHVVTEGERLFVRTRSVRASGDTSSLDYVYRADGEASNTLRGQLVRTRGRHVGRSLEFVSVIKFMMMDLRAEERWSLAAAGDSLFIERTAHSPLGTQRQRLYFAHQGPATWPVGKP
jgi:hypothetical protein